MDCRHDHELVLLVDGCHDTCNLYTFALEAAGLHVVVEHDGLQAVRRTIERTPAVVVLNFTLPRLSGMDACAALRRHPSTREIPIVGLTTVGGAAQRSDAARAGFDRVMLLPCLPQDLVAQVRGVLAWRTARRAAARSPAPPVSETRLDE